VIIDAPGHKEFLRNMLTGASYAEAAVLIIDAKEGIREQTRRHAYLLSLVGIRQIILVINKMDLVEYSAEVFDRLTREVGNCLSPPGGSESLHPMSALSGINVTRKDAALAWYQGPSLVEALDSLDYKTFGRRPFRFPVQDVYSLDGKKSSWKDRVGGSVEGMEILVLPKGKKPRSRDQEIPRF